MLQNVCDTSSRVASRDWIFFQTRFRIKFGDAMFQIFKFIPFYILKYANFREIILGPG